MSRGEQLLADRNGKDSCYVVAARGSRLSLAQTNDVIAQLLAKHPHASFRVLPVTTKGDRDSRPLFTIDQKGIFEKEVDRAVADGRADFAVHSMKDVPSELPAGLALACVPRRSHSHDVLITADGMNLCDMPAGSIIGTSSLRRAVQINRMRPDITVKPIRGNIDTRISRIERCDDLDGIVLAYAGIARLGLDVRYVDLPRDVFLPSPGQGSLAIISRIGDATTASMLCDIEDSDSRSEAEAERAFSSEINSGCRFPVGARARCTGTSIRFSAGAFSIDGKCAVTVDATYDGMTASEAGRRAGQEMLSKGAGELGLKWREGLAEWNRA